MIRKASTKSRLAATNVKALKKTALFSALTDDELAELVSLTRERHLEKGEVLFVEGDPAERLFIILAGSFRAYRVNAQGREQTLHVETTGSTLAEVALFDGGPYPATAVAEEPSIVLALSKDDFKDVCFKHPHVAWSALSLLASRLRRHAELVNALALQEVGPRLAKLLLVEARSTGIRDDAQIRFEIRLSNQQLAARVGTVREVISRTLSRLTLNGLLKIERRLKGGRGYELLIPNESALQSYAGID